MNCHISGFVYLSEKMRKIFYRLQKTAVSNITRRLHLLVEVENILFHQEIAHTNNAKRPSFLNQIK